MKTERVHERELLGRRRFLGLLGGLGAAAAALPLLPRPKRPQRPKQLSLREADFYRPHRLAG
jgi:hypothetical protein